MGLMDIQGDPVLHEIFALGGFQPEPSRIIETDFLAQAFNVQALKGKRIVLLSCRHRAIATTRQHNKMRCPRCVQLMKEGLDYDYWINHSQGGYDGMHWPKDPVRPLNEKTDLAGRFVDDPSFGEDPKYANQS